MPIPIKFGTKRNTSKPEDAEDFVAEEVEVDNNIINPAWTKQLKLTDEDYKNFLPRIVSNAI
jgi:hypothetical protein